MCLVPIENVSLIHFVHNIPQNCDLLLSSDQAQSKIAIFHPQRFFNFCAPVRRTFQIYFRSYSFATRAANILLLYDDKQTNHRIMIAHRSPIITTSASCQIYDFKPSSGAQIRLLFLNTIHANFLLLVSKQAKFH